jgi:HEAT repeat protein
MEVPANVKLAVENLSHADKPVLSSTLADLSNLNANEMQYFVRTWMGLDVSRRRETVNRLLELAEENYELNFDSLFKEFMRDQDPEVRAKAVDGLWENEETALIFPLIRMLNEDPSEQVQAAAAKGLGKYAMLAELKKLGPSSSSRVSQALLAILANKTKPMEVRRRALEAAAPFNLPEVKKAISEAYASSDPALKNSAIFAMGKNCDSAWLPSIIQEMTNTSAETRYEAAGACGEICDEEAVPHLMKLVSDKDLQVQQAAIQALGQIGGNRAKLFLQKLTDSPDEVISESAEAALRQLETEEDSFSI